MPTYGQRLKQARTHSGHSQAALADRIGIKPQTVQYLEDANKAAGGSQYTASLAHICGVDALWLETGKGEMLPATSEARQPAAVYEVVDDARAISAAIAELSSDHRAILRKLLAAMRNGGPRTYALPGRRLESVRLRTRKTGRLA